MLSNEWTKTRRATPPDLTEELHLQDQLYGTDPSQTNPFNPPRPAITFGQLNADVMVSANHGLTDADSPDSEEDNCYTSYETLSKSKQEKLWREATTKFAGVDSLDEATITRFIRETSSLLAISHPDIVDASTTTYEEEGC